MNEKKAQITKNTQHVPHLPVKKAAVLGAGVMGAQIAALLANAGISTILFDLKSSTEDANARTNFALKNLRNLKPSPIVSEKIISRLQPANFTDDLALLGECSLIIEAIAEQMPLKQDLYQKVAPQLATDAIFVSNTSGLSIHQLAEVLPKNLRPRFLGMHFFNPPRYLPLVELIPHDETDKTVLTALEAFLVSALGKDVILAKDTPNFIANRIGIFSMLSVFHHAERFQLPLEIVDALTGYLLGRPKSGTYRLADVVGLDTLAHVVKTMQENLPHDPWHQYYRCPDWLNAMIERKELGQKTQKGIYQKDEQTQGFLVFDPALGQHRPATRKPSTEVIEILKQKDPREMMRLSAESSDPQAQFVYHHLLDLYHYCAVHLAEVANSTRDIDNAMLWGFGWREGPFTTWQRSDWTTIVNELQQNLEKHAMMATVPLPAWVQTHQAYDENKAYSALTNRYLGVSQASVYQRQKYVHKNFDGSTAHKNTIWQSDAVHLWEIKDEIAVLSFKTKMNCVSESVLGGIIEACAKAERQNRALIVWQENFDHFSVGADLDEFRQAVNRQDETALQRILQKFQEASNALRYSFLPTVAAIRGYTLGGGCELAMHCSKIVAHIETVIGLVEASVGLLPAGGGCKEFVKRAAAMSAHSDDLAALKHYYQLVARGVRADNAYLAKEYGYLRPEDPIIMNAKELLYVARQQAFALSESNYRPPMNEPIAVLGDAAFTQLTALHADWNRSFPMSAHDREIATQIAKIFVGGNEQEQGQGQSYHCSEHTLFALERAGFIKLAFTEKTQQRIQYTLETGKPLKN